jgi:hypothetical protein
MLLEFIGVNVRSRFSTKRDNASHLGSLANVRVDGEIEKEIAEIVG